MNYDEEGKKVYNAIVCWVENPSIKNFLKLYKDGFLIRFVWWRPLWRIWRIIRNTIEGTYKEIASDDSLKEMFEEMEKEEENGE